MISAALMLFANTLLFSLRLDHSGSFPRPLSASEERMWLERLAQTRRPGMSSLSGIFALWHIL